MRALTPLLRPAPAVLVFTYCGVLIDRYNPVLGEFFRCRYDYPDGTKGYYIAEQGASGTCWLECALCAYTGGWDGIVSHHPPISAFYYVSPENKVCIVGELRPKSRFLGNSVSTVMEGDNRVYLMGRPDDGGEYQSRPDRFISGEGCEAHLCGGRRRIRDHDAEHVCAGHSVGEDGP